MFSYISLEERVQQAHPLRKRFEEAFVWITLVGGLTKTNLIGQAKLTGPALLCFATYNLVRTSSINGGWDAHHV